MMATSPNTLLPILLAGALATTVLPATAIAEAPDPRESASVEVVVSDLDLTSEAGAMVLIDRIEDAARKVCRQTAATSSLAPRIVHECRRETISRTISELEGDRPLLAALAERADARN